VVYISLRVRDGLKERFKTTGAARRIAWALIILLLAAAVMAACFIPWRMTLWNVEWGDGKPVERMEKMVEEAMEALGGRVDCQWDPRGRCRWVEGLK
jgi:hypothetical protein